MNIEDFNNLWKDSTKEDILNQFYYDYEEMIKSHNIILNAIIFLETYLRLNLDSFDTKSLLKKLLEILYNDKEVK